MALADFQTVYAAPTGAAMSVRMTMAPASQSQMIPPEDLSALVVAIGRDRDRAAFGELFRCMAPRIKAYLMRTGSEAGLAEDLAQDVMLTVWRKAESFDPRLANAGTWMFTIARNRRIDRIRREKWPQADASDPSFIAGDDDPLADAVSSIDGDRVRAAVATLPAEQRDMLELAFFEELPHSAIAEARNLPLGTVKSRIRLAMGRLRKVLEKQ